MKTRKEFANLINERQYKVVAEVGVGWGGFSEYLLTQCPDIHLTSIDPWAGAEYRPGSREKTAERLAKFGDRSKIIVLKSTDALALFEDESFDFIYIDGDHSGEAVKQDIEGWWQKLRKGGVLAGHDYDSRLGSVVSQVDAFVKNNALTLNVTGTEDHYTVEFGEEAQSSSWWFEKNEGHS